MQAAHDLRLDFLYLLSQNSFVVVSADSVGSFCNEIVSFLTAANYHRNGKSLIAVAQPTIGSALSTAHRIAQDRQESVGASVVYRFRLGETQRISSQPIQVVTDCVLLRDLLFDPLLTRYSVVVVDSVSSRFVPTEVLISLLKRIAEKRSELRVVLCARSECTNRILSFLASGGSLSVATLLWQGKKGVRSQPQVFYSDGCTDDLASDAVVAIKQLLRTHPVGDLALFMPNGEQLERLKRALASCSTLQVIKYGDSLQEASRLPGVRSLSLICEADFANDPFFVAIDCGLQSELLFDRSLNCSVLAISRCSKRQLEDRSQTAGLCYRLFSEAQANEGYPDEPISQICKIDLTTMALFLLAIGVSDLGAFDWISPPPASAIAHALKRLQSLGAISDFSSLTEGVGMRMMELPISDPTLARLVVLSVEENCAREVTRIVAMLCQENISLHQSGAVEEGDHLTLLNIYEAFATNNRSSKQRPAQANALDGAYRLCLQLEAIPWIKRAIQQQGKASVQKILRCLAQCFESATAIGDGSYAVENTAAKQQPAFIHPQSVLIHRTPDRVIFTQRIVTSKHYLRYVSRLE